MDNFGYGIQKGGGWKTNPSWDGIVTIAGIAYQQLKDMS